VLYGAGSAANQLTDLVNVAGIDYRIRASGPILRETKVSDLELESHASGVIARIIGFTITTRNKNNAPLRGLLFYALFALVCSVRCIATDVLTYHNDNARTGWNPNEVVLTPANVNPNAFGLLFNLIVDGKVDAQPLYVSNTPVFSGGIFKGNHNLIIVATEHDSLYAFDADTGVLYWQSVLLGSGETTSEPRFGCDQVTPEIGITATPVIDRNKGSHGTIYVVAMSKTSTIGSSCLPSKIVGNRSRNRAGCSGQSGGHPGNLSWKRPEQ